MSGIVGLRTLMGCGLPIYQDTQGFAVPSESDSRFEVHAQYDCAGFIGKSTSWTWKYLSGTNKAVRGKIATHNDFFGYPVFEASTEGYTKSNSGRYKHRSSDRIVAQIWVSAFGNNSCITPNWHADASWPYDSRSTDAKVKFGQESGASFDVINSNHRVYVGDDFVSLDLQLLRCD